MAGMKTWLNTVESTKNQKNHQFQRSNVPLMVAVSCRVRFHRRPEFAMKYSSILASFNYLKPASSASPYQSVVRSKE
jgi:hypothetical protein